MEIHLEVNGMADTKLADLIKHFSCTRRPAVCCRNGEWFRIESINGKEFVLRQQLSSEQWDTVSGSPFTDLQDVWMKIKAITR